MCTDKCKILKEIYNESLQEKNSINENLQNNLNRIEEIDIYLTSVREDFDFKVFSPRSAENIFSDKIKEMEEEKISLLNDNKNYYCKLNKLDNRINQLKEFVDKTDIELSGNISNEKNIKSENEEIKLNGSYKLEILDIQEKERQRIARELHDSSVQNLTHLVHMIELSSMFIDQDPIKAKLELENCIQNLKKFINEIRETIFDLRPMSFDDLGFRQCIENLIANAKVQFRNSEIEYDVCNLEESISKDQDKEKINLFLVTIYRIIQEALLNSLKHSNADEIILNVKSKKRRCYIYIKDNGKGFSLDNVLTQKDKHFGISIMNERVRLLGGNIQIETESKKGTEIKIEIPLI